MLTAFYAEPPVEQRRDALLRDGNELRRRVVDDLIAAHELSFREGVPLLDHRFDELSRRARERRRELVEYDGRVWALVNRLAAPAPFRHHQSGEADYSLTDIVAGAFTQHTCRTRALASEQPQMI